LGAVRDGWRVARAGRYVTESLLSRSRCVLAGIAAGRTGGPGVSVQRTAASHSALLARASLAADPGAVCASGLATLALAVRRAAFRYRDCTGGGGYCRAAV